MNINTPSTIVKMVYISLSIHIQDVLTRQITRSSVSLYCDTNPTIASLIEYDPDVYRPHYLYYKCSTEDKAVPGAHLPLSTPIFNNNTIFIHKFEASN